MKSFHFCREEYLNTFQRLLLASPNSREAINDYIEQQKIDELKAWRSKNQVTSVNQFTDVLPTDWAYQALTNLVERYGCVAGYPNDSYKGVQAMHANKRQPC